MWIGYLKDRQQLGFSCIKDIDSVEQLLDQTALQGIIFLNEDWTIERVN
jgi:hypothetical protein